MGVQERKSNLDNPYNLQRFVDAQAREFEQVRAELRNGSKASHWMWYIFPQMKGLGYSQMSSEYGISSKEEAQAYLAHPVLGPRLRECTGLVLAIQGRSIQEIVGYTDAQKFRSSMTLFSQATADNQIFKDALQKYYGGELDQLTLDRL